MIVPVDAERDEQGTGRILHCQAAAVRALQTFMTG